MVLLVILVVAALVLGVSGLIQGIAWLASVGFILMLILGALAVSAFRKK